MRIWRICSSPSAERAFSGDEGIKSAARWHHEGCRIVYASESLSLAALEFWVHLDDGAAASGFMAASAELPDEIAIHEFEESELPAGWRQHPGPNELRDLGTKWVHAGLTALARVPSAIIPGEFNYLLNPSHADWARARVRCPIAFAFDRRMWKCPGGNDSR